MAAPRRWLLLAAGASASIHDLVVDKDRRALYRIESFCFVEGGVLELDVSDFRVDGRGDPRAGFAMRRAASESAAQQELEESLEAEACILDWTEGARGDGAVFEMDLSDRSKWADTQTLKHVVKAGEEGLYSLVYARCAPDESRDGASSFHLEAKFYNPGPSYLSACEAALPKVFAAFAGLFGLCACVWWFLLCRGGKERVHRVHPLMGVLLILKTLTLAARAARYAAIDRTGSGGGWADAYYGVASLRGGWLFGVRRGAGVASWRRVHAIDATPARRVTHRSPRAQVILLVGTGWSIVKPYLSGRERRIVVVVLVLQVVDNLALVVFEEAAPGSRAWLTWRDVLHLVDIACCVAILMPIVWSIRHLREAAAADGKAADTVGKLTLFRQFYVMVVAYVYFTRIVVFLLAATLPFEFLWLRYVFAEGATLLFYAATGYKFRPREDNPYLAVRAEELEEFGLGGGDAEEPGEAAAPA